MFDNIIIYVFAAVFMYAAIRVLVETMIAEYGVIPTVLLVVVSVIIAIAKQIVENNSQ